MAETQKFFQQVVAKPSAYRIFKTRPSGVFIEEVVNHIKLTGQPETFDGLYHEKLPSNAKYRILRKIEIDGKKRPNEDMAPCPMCTPNRFLSGVLVWVYELNLAALIGHCCAEHANEAEREFARKEAERFEEDYLLAALPRLSSNKNVLEKIRPAAAESLRLYRKFRKGGSAIQAHLRRANRYSGGQLVIIEVLRSAETEEPSDYFGPAGFRGAGRQQTETRDHVIGPLHGPTALLSDYNPTKELENIIRVLSSFEFEGSEELALNFIVTMTPPQRHAAVAIFQSADDLYAKFISRLLDFREFFSVHNIKLLNRYGTHELNDFQFEADIVSWHGRPKISFRFRRNEAALIVGPQLDRLDFKWEPGPSKTK